LYRSASDLLVRRRDSEHLGGLEGRGDTEMKMLFTPLGLLALALAPAAAPAAARSAAAPSVHVSYADLNLASQAGVHALDRRLARAVRTVCAEGSTDLGRQLAARHCIAATRAALAAERQRVVAVAGAPLTLAVRIR
jgi:UrcA family protein